MNITTWYTLVLIEYVSIQNHFSGSFEDKNLNKTWVKKENHSSVLIFLTYNWCGGFLYIVVYSLATND